MSGPGRPGSVERQSVDQVDHSFHDMLARQQKRSVLERRISRTIRAAGVLTVLMLIASITALVGGAPDQSQIVQAAERNTAPDVLIRYRADVTTTHYGSRTSVKRSVYERTSTGDGRVARTIRMDSHGHPLVEQLQQGGRAWRLTALGHWLPTHRSVVDPSGLALSTTAQQLADPLYAIRDHDQYTITDQGSRHAQVATTCDKYRLSPERPHAPRVDLCLDPGTLLPVSATITQPIPAATHPEYRIVQSIAITSRSRVAATAARIAALRRPTVATRP